MSPADQYRAAVVGGLEIELLLRPWKMYADSSGRARRSEYWLFFGIKYGVLFLSIGALFVVTDNPDAPVGAAGVVWSALLVVFILGTLAPSVALIARRAHDFGASGKWCIATFIPYVGFIAVIVIGLIPGTQGENEKGYDPREDRAEDVSAVFE